jgi:hypothetical protein
MAVTQFINRGDIVRSCLQLLYDCSLLFLSVHAVLLSCLICLCVTTLIRTGQQCSNTLIHFCI